MANLRVFVSSTCFDLSVLRAQLRTFIEGVGFEPVMSEYHDVVYDPRTHTHSACIDEVESCDMVVVIIGSRFGGKAIPAAVSKTDLDAIATASKSAEILKRPENMSITQLEVLKAVECAVPVFAFVDDRVLHDHATYEKNKGKAIIDQIEFSSIEKPETAHFIFEFINFLRHRSTNNGVSGYGKYQDIELALKRQWSGLFQRLLLEQRNRAEGVRRIDALTEQFEDLKAAILTAVGSKNERDVARGVVRFRKFLDFIKAMRLPNPSFVISETHTWADFLAHVGVVEIRDADPDQARPLASRPTQYLVKSDGTFYELRIPFRVSDLSEDWEAFTRLSPDVRTVIYDALSEMGGSRVAFHYVRHIPERLEEYLASRAEIKERQGGIERDSTSGS